MSMIWGGLSPNYANTIKVRRVLLARRTYFNLIKLKQKRKNRW